MERKITTAVLALFLALLLSACLAGPSLGESASPTVSPETAAQPALSENAISAVTPMQTPQPVPTPLPAETPGPGKAIIIFTFDDGTVSDYLLAFPILKQYGMRGTSYINTKYVDEGLKGRLTWDQIREMAEYGWVFGAHTHSHQHMTKMSDAEIISDCETVSRSFVCQGVVPPEIMAYPYGNYSSRVISAIQPYYKQARLADDRTDFVDPKNTDPYKIPSVSADMQTESKLNKAKRIVDKACADGAVVVFRTHMLYVNHPFDTVQRNSDVPGGSTPQTDSRLFGELVTYCVDKGCIFMTMTELKAYMNAQQFVSGPDI